MRGELEGLDRESLVVRAQAAGIRRARILTRPELIDELLRLDPSADDAQLKKSRGFFGRARDLVARVVERGLHLPDAADRIRTLTGGGLTLTVPRTEPQAMPTVTLAEIYAAQGHSKRAIETLRRVLEREPEHAAARALLARFEDAAYVAPKPRLPPEPEVEPVITDDAEADGIDADAPTLELSLVERGIKGPSYGDTNGEAEFHMAPASDRILPAEEVSEDPAYAPTRELPRGAGRTYTITAPRTERATPTVDVNARTDVFKVVPERGAAPAPDPVDEEDVNECFAIPISGAGGKARMYTRWNVSFSAIGALLGTRPRGRFVVRAHIVTPSWDGPRTETRDLTIDPDAAETTLQALPEPSVVRVAVGWLDGETFVPLAHSPALEIVRGRGLVIWTPKGAVPVVLDDPRAASIARALDRSKRAEHAHGA